MNLTRALLITALITFTLFPQQNLKISNTVKEHILQFDGIDDYVEIPHNNIFDVTNKFTIEVFVKIHPQSFTFNSIVSKNPNSGWGSGFELVYGYDETNNFSLLGSPGENTVAKFNEVVQGIWYHVAGVYNGQTFAVYVNGQADPLGIQYVTADIVSNKLPIVLGRRSEPGGNTHFLKGSIESVRYSNTALYSKSFTPPDSFVNNINTIGLWKLNEGTGNIIYDYSGYGNNGIIHGATWGSDNGLPPSIKLNVPNGGEKFYINKTHNISWSSENISHVNIQYTTNNGVDWITINNLVQNNRSFEWKVPNTPSKQCKIRITDPISLKKDESDGTFIITLISAEIRTDLVWPDNDFNGSETRQVDGSASDLGEGSITKYEWFVNQQFVSSEVSPAISLYTGSNLIKLIVYSDKGTSASDSVHVTVYSRKISTGGSILSGFSQLGNGFYFTSMNNGVYKTDTTGRISQSYLTSGSIQSALCISSQTGLLYVGSNDTRLYCFDSNLNSIWDKALGGVVSNCVSVNFKGEVVYAGANNTTLNMGLLKSLSALDGNAKWTFQSDGTILSSPLVMELVDSLNNVLKTIVYFGSSRGIVYAVEDLGNTYNLLWSVQISPDSAFISSPAISDNGIIYIGSKNGYLYRFNWDGRYETDWKVNTGGPIVSSPIIDENGIVYISSGSGYLYGYAKNFTSATEPVKIFYQQNANYGTPGFGADGTLFLGSSNGKLFALNKNAEVDMPLKWYFQTSGSISSPVMVTEDGLVIVGINNGDVFILKHPLGSLNKNSLMNYEWPTFKGNNQRSKVARILEGVTSISEESNLITNYRIDQNYPNPFNPETKIQYSIPSASLVSIIVFDVLGNEITKLVNEEKTAGRFEFIWNAKNLPSGIYYYQIKAGSFTKTMKMVLMK